MRIVGVVANGDVGNQRQCWSFAGPLDNLAYAVGFTLHNKLDRSIRSIADPPHHSACYGLSPKRGAIANALYATTDQSSNSTNVNHSASIACVVLPGDQLWRGDANGSAFGPKASMLFDVAVIDIEP
jgi:hypothetical protein